MPAINSYRFTVTNLIPVILGIAAFALVTGGNLLSPNNIIWLQHSDLAQSYLGWAFYRHDAWTLPFGATPSYGLDFHSSVYYSDSIPIVALLLKPIASWLPEPFQYFGLWVLLCFILQAIFAWKILSLATQNVAAKVLGCIFFVMAPPLLFRLYGHMALFAHWAILAALYLYLRPEQTRQRAIWTALVAVCMLIHAYIFLMVAAIWLADLCRRTYQDSRLAQPVERKIWQPVLREVVQVVLVTMLAAWFAGFFMISSGGMKSEGFGYYKMNLLAPFNGAGWSYFGLRSNQGPGEYEGFNYLGLGITLLCVAAAPAWLRQRKQQNNLTVLWPLLLVILVLTFVAITNNVGFGSDQWHISLPEKLQSKLARSSIQATGRLFWVTYYALIVAVFFALVRALSPRWLIAVLAVAVVIQLVDLKPGLTSLHKTLVTRAKVDDAQHLDGAFWTEAGQRYSQARVFPSRVIAPQWEVIARFALEHHMGTDAIQVARVDWKPFIKTRNHQKELISSGTPESQTLYFVDPADVGIVAKSVKTQDAFFRLDGFDVLAPGWGPSLPVGAASLKIDQEL